MITQYDRECIKEAGQDFLLDLTMESKYLKENISFQDHLMLCDKVVNLEYEEVVRLIFTEDIRNFEGKFSKFLKYSIAAIAGKKFLGIAPPVAMFVLYLYRKATDSCVRACFMKLPLSTERKVCKYTCQLNAARKIANDIRSEIIKCREFQNPKKCEKKLMKEWTKWSKRVQQLLIKLNNAKAGNLRKSQKARMKNLKNKGQKLMAGVELTGNVISESAEIRKEFSFEDHIELYKMFADKGV